MFWIFDIFHEYQETNNDQSLASLGAHSDEMGPPNLYDLSAIQDAGEISSDRDLLLADEQVVDC